MQVGRHAFCHTRISCKGRCKGAPAGWRIFLGMHISLLVKPVHVSFSVLGMNAKRAVLHINAQFQLTVMSEAHSGDQSKTPLHQTYLLQHPCSLMLSSDSLLTLRNGKQVCN